MLISPPTKANGISISGIGLTILTARSLKVLPMAMTVKSGPAPVFGHRIWCGVGGLRPLRKTICRLNSATWQRVG